MPEIPRIETERLVLREFRESDLDAYADMSSDLETMRYLGAGKTLTREEAWRSLAFLIGHWELCGYGMWAVEERASGSFVGRVGFFRPEGWPGFEIGWTIARSVWGRGFATEAATKLLPLAAGEYGQSHVISLISPGNAASIRVAEKLGESLEGEAEIKGNRVLIYGMELA